MPPKTKFQEGEKVLCFHGPLLYEAKCTKVDVKDKQTKYHIHYNGWNKNWDEWVPESRVLKFNEAGFQKQKELMKAHGAVRKASKGGRKADKKEKEKKEEKEKVEKEEKEREKESKEKEPKEKEKEKEKEKKAASTPQTSTKKEKEKPPPPAPPTPATPTPSTPSTPAERISATSSPAPEPKRKRPRVDPTTVETEDVFMSRIEVKIKMPDELKPWLVDDWDLITRQKMLVNLPCKNTVDNILDEYVKSKTAKSNANKDAIIETMEGVKEYFNVMLGTQLLYKFERPQYGEIMAEHPDKPMSSVFGATHLLRLFVRLGQMLAYTSLDEKCVQILLTHIHDFLKYMLKNATTLFNLNDYGIAPPEYHRKAI
ncbi:mortality factor 4-like protein 1 [Littorina saxatilis]|uniref:Mortality factor 4-like protein 1 n=1 Tax=Littorina saxatilis TaxID=31220 RepID=A0AAN9C213_9CAEN